MIPLTRLIPLAALLVACSQQGTPQLDASADVAAELAAELARPLVDAAAAEDVRDAMLAPDLRANGQRCDGGTQCASGVCEPVCETADNPRVCCDADCPAGQRKTDAGVWQHWNCGGPLDGVGPSCPFVTPCPVGTCCASDVE